MNNPNGFPINDHDLLIRIDERVEKIEKELSNHLSVHSKVNLVAWTTAVGAIITAAGAIFTLLLYITQIKPNLP